MKRELQVSVFLTFITLAYYLLNSLALEFLGVEFISIPLTIILPASILFERARPNPISRATYIFSMLWLVFLIYLLMGWALVQFIWFFMDLPWLRILAVSLAALSVSYGVFRARKIEVKHLEIPFPVERRVRFVQLSDIHLGTVRSAGFLKEVSGAVRRAEPAAVLITGDLLDGSRPVDSRVLSSLETGAPIFFVSGNHDIYSGDFRSTVSDAGIRCIDQSVIDFEGIQIIGVGYSMERHSLPAILDMLDFDGDRPALLLHHLPVDWGDARERGIDLQLSGHTHGGQFYPFNIIVGLMFPFLRGLYSDSGRFLYVSEGTGTWGPPVRLGSSCEVTVIDLVPAKADFNDGRI